MHTFWRWAPLAVAISVLSLTIYIVGQQILRQTANDQPSIIASNIAAQLEAGKAPADVMPSGEVELGTSRGPFVMIYAAGDDSVPTTNNARINGQPIKPPAGVISEGRRHHNYVTWQPQYGYRFATVAWRADSGAKVVYVGQSLLDTEQHIQQIGRLVLLGWAAAIFLTFIKLWFLDWIVRKKPTT